MQAVASTQDSYRYGTAILLCVYIVNYCPFPRPAPPLFLLLAFSTDHSGAVTGVKFGKNAAFIASVGMDRTLKYYGQLD